MITCDSVHEAAVRLFLYIGERYDFVRTAVVISETVVVHLYPHPSVVVLHARKGICIVRHHIAGVLIMSECVLALII